MRELSLQKTALISLALHLIVFMITVLILKQSNRFVMPSPYTVNLVSPDILHKSAAGKRKSDTVIRDITESIAHTSKAMKSKKDTEKENQFIKEKISALEAKKKIERIVKLRSMISLRAGADDHSVQTTKISSSHAKGDLFDDYYRKITQEIWQQWIYPDTRRKDIEAIVSIRILKDGTALVQRVEKSSGNALFDRSALKALAKASPLAPPPYEMEIGVRFYP
ncbi:MAG TPA: energy transducer TonB [Thermodesulfovibrionales bacterium]|jgi:colicin import membrane protein|nr:energy transducer TonB [Thermodesulfovibrionales bacterium]